MDEVFPQNGVNRKLCAIWRLIETGFLYPSYLRNGQEKIIVTGPFYSINYIRIGLLETEYLHLKRINIVDIEGLEIAPLAILKVSSVWSELRDFMHIQSVLDPKEADGVFTLHTDREQNPYVELTFAQCVDISQIMILNRQDEFARRARTLAVWVGGAADLAVKVFDQSQKTEDLKAAIFRAFAQPIECADTANMVSFAIEAFDLVAKDSFDDLYVLCERPNCSGVQPHYEPIVIQFINEYILYKKQLEITRHGVVRTFRFWTLDEKQKYVRLASRIISILNHNKRNACFGYGTVLGFLREGGLIPHDDDIDILVAFEKVFYPTFRAAMDWLQRLFSSIGIHLEGDFATHRKIHYQNYVYDIFIGLIEDEYITFLPGPRKKYFLERYFPPSTIPTTVAM